ncbi:MAG: hypothetical protein PHS02_00305 [Candidatus ainarchaeum sp.]|nr:hypothetical protein [Candidatus ainarchaeum sp.]
MKTKDKPSPSEGRLAKSISGPKEIGRSSPPLIIEGPIPISKTLSELRRILNDIPALRFEIDRICYELNQKGITELPLLSLSLFQILEIGKFFTAEADGDRGVLVITIKETK